MLISLTAHLPAFAGALMQIIQTQPDPRPLCAVIVQFTRMEATRPSVAHSAASAEEPSAAAGPADEPRAQRTTRQEAATG